jgi:hypothetical protein
MGRPNTYVELSDAQADLKVHSLCECFASQRAHGWFRAETFRALLTLRGIECNASSGYAEAFYGRKIRIEFG